MQAVVLGRRDFRERDQLVMVYTRDAGKIEVLAKGLKKSTSKNAAALLPFFLLEIEIVPGRDIGHLTKVQILESYREITSSLLKMKMLSLSFDHLNKAIRGQENDRHIFDGLKEWLNFLNVTKEPNIKIIDVFFIKMWAYLGFKIELDRCVSCGKKESFGMDIKNGGVLCRACTVRREVTDRSILLISKKELQTLKIFMVKKLSAVNSFLTGVETEKIHSIIHDFIEYHSHTPIADWAKLLVA